METTRPPFTRHNIVIAGLSLLTTARYWWMLADLNADMAEHARRGDRGEAVFIILIPLFFLLLYAGVFSLVSLGYALRRGSEPMPGLQLFLGLLPLWLWLLRLLFRVF